MDSYFGVPGSAFAYYMLQHSTLPHETKRTKTKMAYKNLQEIDNCHNYELHDYLLSKFTSNKD